MVGGGPPLCALDGFEYQAATHRLQRGDTLCLITDGVTDARNAAGERFGRERLERRLATVGADADVPSIVAALRADVAAFVAGGEAADDLAILVLRWDGPSAVSGR
jgi:serine phosphatase RsbU (regulator of sigma subunit)